MAEDRLEVEVRAPGEVLVVAAVSVSMVPELPSMEAAVLMVAMQLATIMVGL